MKHSPFIIATLLLTGCGVATQPQADPSGFINQTTATTTQLQALWQGAQQALANPPHDCIPIDPVTNPQNPGCWAPMPAALQIQPDGLTVQFGPAPYNSYGEFQVSGTDSPDGWAWGEAPSGYRIVVAPIYLLTPGETGYEMQNAMLQRMGKDVSGR